MNTTSAQSALIGLTEMDLGPIRFKLANREEGEGWDISTCDVVEKAYRMFLALCIAYPAKNIVPTKLVDKMWHYHILDTRKYEEDCKKFLGRFLHHFPYFGMRGEDDKVELMLCGQETRSLYADNFDFDIAMILSETSLCGPENCEPSCTGPAQAITDRLDWCRPTA